MSQSQRKLNPEVLSRVARTFQGRAGKPPQKAQVSAPTLESEAPSMVPEKRKPAPPPKKEKEVIPTIEEVVQVPKDRVSIMMMAERMVEIARQIRPLEVEKERLGEAMKRLAGEYKVNKMDAGMYRINYFNAPRSTLDPIRLLAQGVTQAMIDEATVTKDCYTMRVTVGKEEEK